MNYVTSSLKVPSAHSPEFTYHFTDTATCNCLRILRQRRLTTHRLGTCRLGVCLPGWGIRPRAAGCWAPADACGHDHAKGTSAYHFVPTAATYPASQRGHARHRALPAPACASRRWELSAAPPPDAGQMLPYAAYSHAYTYHSKSCAYAYGLWLWLWLCRLGGRGARAGR